MRIRKTVKGVSFCILAFEICAKIKILIKHRLQKCLECRKPDILNMKPEKTTFRPSFSSSSLVFTIQASTIFWGKPITQNAIKNKAPKFFWNFGAFVMIRDLVSLPPVRGRGTTGGGG